MRSKQRLIGDKEEAAECGDNRVDLPGLPTTTPRRCEIDGGRDEEGGRDGKEGAWEEEAEQERPLFAANRAAVANVAAEAMEDGFELHPPPPWMTGQEWLKARMEFRPSLAEAQQ